MTHLHNAHTQKGLFFFHFQLQITSHDIQWARIHTQTLHDSAHKGHNQHVQSQHNTNEGARTRITCTRFIQTCLDCRHLSPFLSPFLLGARPQQVCRGCTKTSFQVKDTASRKGTTCQDYFVVSVLNNVTTGESWRRVLFRRESQVRYC